MSRAAPEPQSLSVGQSRLCWKARQWARRADSSRSANAAQMRQADAHQTFERSVRGAQLSNAAGGFLPATPAGRRAEGYPHPLGFELLDRYAASALGSMSHLTVSDSVQLVVGA